MNTIRKILCVFLIAFVISCGQSDNLGLMVKGSNNWSNEIYINDQPAFIGFGNFITDLAPFTTNGKNLIKLKAKQFNSNMLNELNTEIYTVSSSQQKKLKVFRAPQDTDKLEAEFQFRFKTSQKVWEKAEDISQISAKDKKTIFQKVIKLQNAFKSKTIKSLINMEIYQWEQVDGIPIEGVHDDLVKILNELFSNPGNVVTCASTDKLTIKNGSKLVLVIGGTEPIIKISPREETSTYHKWNKFLVIYRLYFAKLDGKWRMLHMLNDNVI